MNKQITSYPAKLIVFGEYGILCGGEALAVPYPKYNAQWIIDSTPGNNSSEVLRQYVLYLKNNNFYQTLQLEKLESDLNKGYTIKSTIPFGYGVGSSGALVAAVYDMYALNKNMDDNVYALKDIFAQMENFFHEKSSGIDPLVCYLNKAVLLKKEVIYIQPTTSLKKNIPIHLVDTEKSRHTHALVETYKNLLKNFIYHERIITVYLPIVNKCIYHYLHDNMPELKSSLLELSMFQLQYFDFAIPETVRSKWQQGIDSGKNIFKLCGAGGGGFMLSFSM